MIPWTQFALRRRTDALKFVQAMQGAGRDMITSRLVELHVDPTTFPWHVLERQIEEPLPVVIAPEPPAPDHNETQTELADG